MQIIPTIKQLKKTFNSILDFGTRDSSKVLSTKGNDFDNVYDDYRPCRGLSFFSVVLDFCQIRRIGDTCIFNTIDFFFHLCTVPSTISEHISPRVYPFQWSFYIPPRLIVDIRVTRYIASNVVSEMSF